MRFVEGWLCDELCGVDLFNDVVCNVIEVVC